MFFVTNTAQKTPADCVVKMQNMGYSGAKESHVYTMASVVAKYVVKKYPDVRKVLVIGMKSMREMLEAHGIEVIGAD